MTILQEKQRRPGSQGKKYWGYLPSAPLQYFDRARDEHEWLTENVC